jgi:hypothetical protein
VLLPLGSFRGLEVIGVLRVYFTVFTVSVFKKPPWVFFEFLGLEP